MPSKILTRSGTRLYVTPKQTLAHSRSDDIAGGHELELWRLEGSDLAIVTTKERSLNFAFTEASPFAAAHIVRIVSTGDDVALLDFWSRTYLSAQPLPEGTETLGLSGGRLEIKAWELFSISDAEPEDDERATALYLAPFIRNGRAAAGDLTKAIADGPANIGIIAAVLIALMSHRELLAFAQSLLTDGDQVRALARMFPNDPWASKALPDLARWLDDDRPELAGQSVLPQSLKGIFTQGRGSFTSSPAHLVYHSARKSVLPRKGCCLVATARNEGIYLVEWISYYKSIGFEKIIIYSNDNSDGSDDLLTALAQSGEITWINNVLRPGDNAQERAYAHALGILPNTLNYEWLLFADLDEFLIVNSERYGGLHDFIDWHSRRDADAIAVNWQLVGASAQFHWRDEPITSRLGNLVGRANVHVKSFVRPHAAISQQPHFPRPDERSHLTFVAASGELHSWIKTDPATPVAPALSDKPSITHAAIYHYFYKSVDEFIWKFSRNRGNHSVNKHTAVFAITQSFLKSFMGNFRANDGDARSGINSMCPDLSERINEIRRHPKIGKAEDSVISNYRTSIEEIRERFLKHIEDRWPETARDFNEMLLSQPAQKALDDVA